MRADLYWIEIPGPGRLAVMVHPFGGDWLEADLRKLHKDGVDVIVSMLMPDEAEELDLAQEQALCSRVGMGFESLPVPDMDVPASAEDVLDVARRIIRHLETSRSVVIHCRMGMGRSPLLAAAVLVRLGVPAEEALDRVSRARGLDVPTLDEQKEWVRRLAGKRP